MDSVIQLNSSESNHPKYQRINHQDKPNAFSVNNYSFSGNPLIRKTIDFNINQIQ